jgi:hypothetical protein
MHGLDLKNAFSKLIILLEYMAINVLSDSFIMSLKGFKYLSCGKIIGLLEMVNSKEDKKITKIMFRHSHLRLLRFISISSSLKVHQLVIKLVVNRLLGSIKT